MSDVQTVKKSRVREAVEQLLAEIEMRDNPPAEGEWRGTIRLRLVGYHRLLKVSEKLEMSKTACAAMLVEAALADAWDELGLGEIDGEELFDLNERLLSAGISDEKGHA